MTKMSFADAGFLNMETIETPMHVGGLQILELPEGYEGSFYEDYRDVLIKRVAEVPMLTWVLAQAPMGLDYPSLVDGGEVDWDYHVRSITLDAPGTPDQLNRLVEKLHAPLLDRKRPLFEHYVIEGLENGNVAVYSKFHHSIMDGQTSMQVTQVMYDTAPEGREPLTPEQIKEFRLDRKPAQKPSLLGTVGKTIVDRIENPLYSKIPALLRIASAAVTETNKQLNRADKGAAALGFAPKTIFNETVTADRRFVTGNLPMDDIKAIRKATGTKINDVMVATIGGGLRRYLKDFSALPKESLVCGAPVALAQSADSANSVSVMALSFGTDEADPIVRLGKVSQSAKFGKEAFAGLQGAIDKQTNFAMPAFIGGPLMSIFGNKRVAGLMPAALNAVVSNVPGVPFDLYIAGAKLVGNYPVSIVSHGIGLNVTLVSHKDTMCFGLIGCPEVAPELDNLMGYIEEEFEALKTAALKPQTIAEDKAEKAAQDAPAAAEPHSAEVVSLNVA